MSQYPSFVRVGLMMRVPLLSHKSFCVIFVSLELDMACNACSRVSWYAGMMHTSQGCMRS